MPLSAVDVRTWGLPSTTSRVFAQRLVCCVTFTTIRAVWKPPHDPVFEAPPCSGSFRSATMRPVWSGTTSPKFPTDAPASPASSTPTELSLCTRSTWPRTGASNRSEPGPQRAGATRRPPRFAGSRKTGSYSRCENHNVDRAAELTHLLAVVLCGSLRGHPDWVCGQVRSRPPKVSAHVSPFTSQDWPFWASSASFESRAGFRRWPRFDSAVRGLTTS